MLTLALRETSRIPIEIEGITPDRLLSLSLDDVCQLPVRIGNRTVPLGELFAVVGDPADAIIHFRGNLECVKGIGADMASGRIVAEQVGIHAGARMTGGTLELVSAGNWLGAEMRGGRIVVSGNAGNSVGGAYLGSRLGMSGGEIIVLGYAGDEVGNRMRRGLIAVNGRCGAFAGASMIAGSLFALGGVGERAGAGMKRGTIVVGTPDVELPRSFGFSCEYRPSFLGIYFRYLASFHLLSPLQNPSQVLRCYRGDLLTGGRGEVFVPV